MNTGLSAHIYRHPSYDPPWVNSLSNTRTVRIFLSIFLLTRVLLFDHQPARREAAIFENFANAKKIAAAVKDAHYIAFLRFAVDLGGNHGLATAKIPGGGLCQLHSQQVGNGGVHGFQKVVEIFAAATFPEIFQFVQRHGLGVAKGAGSLAVKLADMSAAAQ